MFVLKLLCAGFFSAIGWWSAEYYVIKPYLPVPEAVRRVEDDDN